MRREEGRRQNPEARSQKTGDRSQKPGDRSQKPGDRSQNPGDRSQNPEDRSQNPGARSQNPGARSQKPESRSQNPGARRSGLRPSAFRILPSLFWLLASGSWLLSLFWLLAPGSWLLSPEIIDRIAISVGNQVITESQIGEEIRLTGFLNQEKLNLDPGEKKAAADRLIEQTLVRREMEFSRYPLPELSDTGQSLKSIRARYKSDADYQQALDTYGITEDGLKRRLWWQATLLRFIDYRFRPGIQIPDADVQAFYQQELAKWKQEGIQPVPSLEDVRDNIEQTLTEQRIDQALDRWLADTRTQVAVRYHNEAPE
jgi:hypothetical protein